MWINEHPWIFVYFVGVFCTFILLLVKYLFIKIYCWITKENILQKNLKKILPDDDPAVGKWKFAFPIGSGLINCGLSWLGLLLSAIDFLMLIVNIIRNIFTRVPEGIKILRFPLYNNVNLSPEATWAHYYALQVKFGEVLPEPLRLAYELKELAEINQKFNKTVALKHLDNLNILDKSFVPDTIEQLASIDMD